MRIARASNRCWPASGTKRSPAIYRFSNARRRSVERRAARDEVSLVQAAEALTFDVNFEAMTGTTPGPCSTRSATNFTTAAQAYAAWPLDLPESTFRRALRARDRLLAVHDRIVRERLAKPGFGRAPTGTQQTKRGP